MKIVITMEDLEDDNVEVQYDFDPPMEADTVMTPAGYLAAAFAGIVEQNKVEEDDGDTESELIVPSSKYIL